MSQQIPQSARWNRSYSLARYFIKNKGIDWLPIDLVEIYRNENWLIIKAEKGKEFFPKYNWHKFYKDEIDAVTYKKRGYYITIFNEKFPRERIRWTLAHEIGHIVLGHLDDFEETKIFRSGLTDEKYGVLEQEAHAFASELLTPSFPLLACRITNRTKIQKICKISKEAAIKREITLKKRKSVGIPFSEASFYKKQFRDFLNQRVCKRCGHYFIIPNAKYCPICGSDLIEWGEGNNNMIYDSFDLNQNGKAKICPVCENEEILEGDYCKVCGTNLINKCLGHYYTNSYNEDYFEADGCGLPVDGNARFCHICGGITTYYQNKILQSWRQEYNKKMGVPELDSEEIPF